MVLVREVFGGMGERSVSKLGNIIGCQNWQMLSVAKIGKF